MSDTDIIEQAAKAMFESVHSYHPDLNWDNAYQSHKDLYIKLARVVEDIYRPKVTTEFLNNEIARLELEQN